MGCIAAQENAPIAKPGGDHASACPVLFSENLELKIGTYAQNLANAAVTIEACEVFVRRSPVVDEPSFEPVNREQVSTAARIERNTQPRRLRHQAQQMRSTDVGRLRLHHRRIAAEA